MKPRSDCEIHLKINKAKSVVRTSHNLNAFIIEGGGTKGIYALGILKYLSEDNPYINLSDVTIFGGTSVGSYLATALSLGYQTDDLMQISKLINIGDLFDHKYFFLITLSRFMWSGHLYKDNGRRRIIQKILDYKLPDIQKHCRDIVTSENLTFRHLKQLIQDYPTIYRHLLINVVDISRNEQIFMTTLDDKWDNINILDAILASSAIPFVFKPLTLYYYPNTCTYGYESKPNCTVNMLIDGGVSTNNPTDYFLINNDTYHNYNLWLLKFTGQVNHVNINGKYSLLKQLIEYLISGKNDIKTDLLEEEYRINVINLNLNTGTLDVYNQNEIQQIIMDIYQKCIDGKLFFVSNHRDNDNNSDHA